MSPLYMCRVSVRFTFEEVGILILCVIQATDKMTYIYRYNRIKGNCLSCRESTAGGGRGTTAGGTSMGSSTLVPDRSSTPVATEYADDVAGEALGNDDDASETDEPSQPAPAPPQDNQHHDDNMGDR